MDHINTRIFPNAIAYLLAVIILTAGCGEDENEFIRDQDFNTGWNFLDEDVNEAELPGFDDSGWRPVDLPHDWSLEDYPVQDSLHVGPFYTNLPGGQDVGYQRNGTGWYRKTFTLDELEDDQHVFIHFDGVQTQMKLWVNGKEVGEHTYGYTPFYFDITQYLNDEEEKNTIAVRVVNPGENSRWFAGAGIYRDVSLSILNPIFIDIWGLSITTPRVDESEAMVDLKIDVRNTLNEEMDIDVESEIIAPNGSAVRKNQLVKISADTEMSISENFMVENPDLWEIDDPSLYLVRITIRRNDQVMDQYFENFGMRSIDFSAENGFLLNGNETLLKGACMHHDNGLLGAAAFHQAEERRVRIMKDNGYNAIRTSHNPPSKAFLDACDKLGMLVIDESFDHWVKPKRPNDYHLYFNDWWQEDTKAMLFRDRNHPSVIMWSIGNEIQERADSSGLEIARNMIELVKSIDDTRPVTMAICGFWDNPGLEWDDTAPAFDQLDVGGYNYQWAKYEEDHEKYPSRIMFGSESVPKEAFDNWQLVEKLPYVIGDFVWTGMDYIGESGIGHSTYKLEGDKEGTFLQPWPWYVSWCGDIDIIGNKKPQSYFRDILWGESKLEIAVHGPVPEGHYEMVSFWGWPLEEQNWNWQGKENQPMEVSVYSTYPEVRLELNGEALGVKEVSEASRFTASFTVPYQPGELKAVAMENGEEVDTKVLKTTGQINGLKLMPERSEFVAERSEIVYIRVEAIDEEGNVVPDDRSEVKVDVSGAGELIAAGNGGPIIDGSVKDHNFSLYNGRGLVVIRSSGNPGVIKIEMQTGDLGASANISAK